MTAPTDRQLLVDIHRRVEELGKAIAAPLVVPADRRPPRGVQFGLGSFPGSEGSHFGMTATGEEHGLRIRIIVDNLWPHEVFVPWGDPSQ